MIELTKKMIFWAFIILVITHCFAFSAGFSKGVTLTMNQAIIAADYLLDIEVSSAAKSLLSTYLMHIPSLISHFNINTLDKLNISRPDYLNELNESLWKGYEAKYGN